MPYSYSYNKIYMLEAADLRNNIYRIHFCSNCMYIYTPFTINIYSNNGLVTDYLSSQIRSSYIVEVEIRGLHKGRTLLCYAQTIKVSKLFASACTHTIYLIPNDNTNDTISIIHFMEYSNVHSPFGNAVPKRTFRVCSRKNR